MSRYSEICNAVEAEHLSVMGGLHENAETLILLGPGTEFWAHIGLSPEMQDGQRDPIDRWSKRIITGFAEDLDATPFFPFGGPPHQPFMTWAIATGRAWQSPVGMLVHDESGMFVSYRGALKFNEIIDLPNSPDSSPCASCDDRPCVSACPVGALSDAYFYKLDDCHSFLETPGGRHCMTGGCLARRACPVSQAFGRDPAQSALHMEYFHPK